LREVTKHFYVVVWTAAVQEYADAILDILDPNRELIKQRFYRQHCVKSEGGIYIKDLRMFDGIDLKDIVIVDNAVYSFGF
jgi:TFIIF-interacting CTD phosphatase-like protein